MTNRPLVAVIGGGISGLAAAMRLAESGRVQIAVLEAEPHVGGKLALRDLHGVPVDAGAESFLTRRPEAVDLIQAVGLGNQLVAPTTTSAAIVSMGGRFPMPPHTILGVPAGPTGLTSLLPAEEIAAVTAESGRQWSPIENDLTVGELVRQRFGPVTVNRLVDPLLGGVYAGHADQLSLQATMPALWEVALRGESMTQAVRDLGRTSIARNAPGARPVFAGLRGGVGQLPILLKKRLDATGSVQIRTATTVRAIRQTTQGWRLTIGAVPWESVLDVDGVVLAVPASAAARLLRGVTRVGAQSAATALAEVPYASVALVSLLFDSAGTAGIDGSGLLLADGALVKAVTFSSNKWAWQETAASGQVVLRASVGRYGDERVLQRDDPDLIAAVLQDLRRIPGLRVPTPIAASVFRWGSALPQYRVGHVSAIAQIRAGVRELPGVALAGAAYDGVGIPACIASGYAAAHEVLTQLQSRSRHPGDYANG
ncbi:MAG: protoporphyrinogen oxidase [Actinomycetota bacterium]